MDRHGSFRKIPALSAIAVAFLIAFGLGPVFGDRAPADKVAPETATLTPLSSQPGCWSNGRLAGSLSLLSDEGGFTPAATPEESVGGTERPPVRRTCRCSCGYPCTTSADCDGAPCTVGITCC